MYGGVHQRCVGGLPLYIVFFRTIQAPVYPPEYYIPELLLGIHISANKTKKIHQPPSRVSMKIFFLWVVGLSCYNNYNNIRQYQGDLSSWLSYLSFSPHVSRDTAQLPCYVLPPIRMISFFNRDVVIEKIESHFNNGNSTAALRSLVLYGMGGVGKSYVAMKYLEKNMMLSSGFKFCFSPAEYYGDCSQPTLLNHQACPLTCSG